MDTKLSPCARVVFDGPEATLADMLRARERRAERQRALMAGTDGDVSLLSATLAIPGPHKTSPLLVRVLDNLLEQVREALDGAAVLEVERDGGVSGPEVRLLVRLPACELKRRMAAIEREHPLGRLADLDVLEHHGAELRAVPRTEVGEPPRTCLICGSEAKLCARSRAHSVIEMQEAIAGIVQKKGCIAYD